MSNHDELLNHFNNFLTAKDYLVGNSLTIADFALFGALKGSNKFSNKNANDLKNLSKYFTTLSNHKFFQGAVSKAADVLKILKNIYQLQKKIILAIIGERLFKRRKVY